MLNLRPVGHALAVLAVLLLATPSYAQIYETVGIRAQGMGGAFVAVADDATATWWNPAGLATGPVVGMIFEIGHTTEPADQTANAPAWRADDTGFSMAFPSLGVSYYRLRVSEIQRFLTTVTDPEGGEQQTVTLGLRSMAMSQYGATFGQSLGGSLVLASTLKLVRAGQVTSTDASGTDLLEQAADLDVPVENKGDLDIGVMASVARLRLGMSIKHLREPEFGEGLNLIKLSRQARAGAAILGGPFGPISSITAAVDFDLTDTPTATGNARHVATGVEAYMFGRIVGLRAGLSANTASDSREDLSGGRSTSLGLSVGLQGLYFDSAFVFGSDRSREGWTMGGRVTF